MRSPSIVLVVLACAFVGASISVVDAAPEVNVHIRVATTDNASGDAVAATEPATDASQHLKQPQQEHLRAQRQCRHLTHESWRNQITSMCAYRGGGFNFYYKLTDGRIMRNCDCESYNDGVLGVDLGHSTRRGLNVQCFTKTSLSGKEVVAIFNHKNVRCSPFEFD